MQILAHIYTLYAFYWNEQHQQKSKICLFLIGLGH